MLPKTSVYVKSYEGTTKWMLFFFWLRILNYQKNKDIWNKASHNIKKELHRKPIYNKTFLKTKIKSYSDMAADFYVNTLKRKKKTTRYFIGGLEISSDDSDEFDEE